MIPKVMAGSFNFENGNFIEPGKKSDARITTTTKNSFTLLTATQKTSFLFGKWQKCVCDIRWVQLEPTRVYIYKQLCHRCKANLRFHFVVVVHLHAEHIIYTYVRLYLPAECFKLISKPYLILLNNRNFAV